MSIGRCEDDAVWAPLERLERLLAADGVCLNLGEFMHMATVEGPSGTPLQLYKNRETRRYLNLDAAGHAYRYRPRGAGHDYELLRDLLNAVGHAVGGAAYLKAMGSEAASNV